MGHYFPTTIDTLVIAKGYGTAGRAGKIEAITNYDFVALFARFNLFNLVSVSIYLNLFIPSGDASGVMFFVSAKFFLKDNTDKSTVRKTLL